MSSQGPKIWLAKLHDQTTPEQRGWLTALAVAGGTAMVWRAAHTMWPRPELWIIAAAIFAAGLVSYVNLMRCSPTLRRPGIWGIPIFLGGFLNHLAVAANAGYMPTSAAIVMGTYRPLDGANLAYLGDWIYQGLLSPGDILIFMGWLGVVLTLALRRSHGATNQV